MEKKRLSQLISLLVATMAVQGLLSTQAFAVSDFIIDDAQNSRTITGSAPLVHITETGSVTAVQDSALTVDSGATITTLNNDGTITGYHAINNLGTIENLTNAGTITSNINNINSLPEESGAIYNSGTIGILHNIGTLKTENNNGFGNAGILNRGTIHSIINDGQINSNVFGINNQGAIDTIENNGQITADVFGILNNSNNNAVISTITNNGGISASNFGIYFVSFNNQNATTTIVNNGELSGGIYALYVQANNILNLNANTDVTLINTNLIKGDIYTNSSTPLKINGGTLTTGVLTGQNGIGTLTSANADVIFGTGSLLLNDNVVVPNGTVQNSAASLQVNSPAQITGNYHQNAAATLVSGVSDLAISNGSIASDAGYGRLNVTGNAIVDAGSHVNLLRTGTTYKFAEGQRYVVISAAGASTDYHADKLNYKAVGYRGAVNGSVYEDGANKALVLTLGAAPSTTTPIVTQPTAPGILIPSQPAEPSQPAPVARAGWATTPTATAALGGLSNYSGIASPQLLNLFNASLALEGKQEANRVGESLSPAQNINTSTAATVATSTAQSVVGAHIDAVRNPASSGTSGVATGDDYSSNWIVWGQPFGGYARQDSSSDVSGYTAKFGGLILGADRSLNDDWRMGAAVNYSNTSVHGKDSLSGNTSTADNYGVIGYAGYTGNPWYLNLSAGLNRQNYDSVRRADFTGFSGTAKGKFNGQSVTLQTEFGYPFTLPASVVLTPLASLTYGYQHVDGYKESGGNGMALDVGSTHSQSVVSDMGARIEKTFVTGIGNLTPFAQVSWLHQYDNRQVSSRASYAADTVGETSFITKGASPVKDMAGVAIGSTLYEADALSFDARYDLQAGDRYQAHTFSLRLRKMF
ncbi:autotransporter domain-containing protein [Enterobacter sp. RHBSTW-00994]|uniref:autotransporter family protein n=1 Tax=Enterobacter sp. RHBSTW-00994 TaxID=2742676 RepID=UPI0015E9E50B|nr:autotransporter domain-containing protein [Enterobacter sp. RHBSTW-00994]QLR44670.1 autotransporter domain-containing protein [Enterobacter sp. RHBSTW-00994]